jgi:hypothetical protein
MMLEVGLQRMNEAQNAHEFSTWLNCSLQRLQGLTENILHAIEFFQHNLVTVDHELKRLSESVGLKMGHLAEDYFELSYKTRYPVEIAVNNLTARMIDDAEAIKECP